MADKSDFAARLLRLELEIATYAKVHQEELDQLQTTLEALKQEFLIQDYQGLGNGLNDSGKRTRKS